MGLSKEFIELAKHAAKRTAPANFSTENVNEAFREELQTYCSSIAQFMKNRYDLYEIITSNADEIVPANLSSAIGLFADIVQVPQGARATFRTGKVASKLRARKFLTQVGLSGVYESFRLDSSTFDISAKAYGGAATIDFERMLDGHETLADAMDVISNGLTDAAFMEVQRALRALINSTDIPAVNKVISTTFEADKMFKLCSIAKAYDGGVASGGAVIFAPPEFIAAMGPDAIVPGLTGAAVGIYSPNDIEAIHRTGYVQLFRGTPIVQMPQSFTDTTNTTTYVDPQIAYVMPTGGEKVVKLVLEGNTQMYDWTNKDNSLEVQVYRKIGAAVLGSNGTCAYQNSSITQTMLGA